MSDLEARTVPADRPPASALLAATVAEIEAIYESPLDDGRSPTATPAEMGPPHGAYVVLYEAGRAVAGGGVKRLSPDTAEIKRMYVVPEARGRGVARALLAALEDAARSLGYARIRLDTGPRQHAALALYRSAGYAEIDDYNGNPFAGFWGEKELASPT